VASESLTRLELGGGGEAVRSASVVPQRLVYVDEVHLYRTPDGGVWAEGWGGYAYLEHFLKWFSTVTLVARLKELPTPPPGTVRCDGPGVSFHAVPDYLGPKQYLRRAIAVTQSLKSAPYEHAIVLMRTPSLLAANVGTILSQKGIPFGLFVVADPAGNFQAGANDHLLRVLFRWKYVRDLRRLIRRATGVAYVTQRSLQSRYPARSGGLQASFSDVQLDEECYRKEPRTFSVSPRPLRVVTVGSFVQLYKGQDVLLHALALCRREGLPVEATFVGDGSCLAGMRALASELGLSGAVSFAGRVPFGAPVRAFLDASDLFVLPSRSEGLPRALVEAMARALPCIATDVGGNGELLPRGWLVPSDAPAALARQIIAAAGAPEELTACSWRNLQAAYGYRSSEVQAMRGRFYGELMALTNERLHGRSRSDRLPSPL
jgi:phosphatidyl-myo-inositol dimannoside synthase